MIEKITEKITRKYLRTFMEKHATKNKTLEIGAKNSPYRDLFPNVVATDIEDSENIDKVVDAHDIPYKDCSFNTILCTEVLEHCHSPQKAMDEFYRVLKPSGKLILTTRFVFPIHDAPNDYYRFTKYGLKHLANKFKKITIIEETATLETVSVLLQRIAYQSVLLVKFPIINILFHITAKLLAKFSWISKQEYGDITRKTKETIIMTSGYYLVAIK